MGRRFGGLVDTLTKLGEEARACEVHVVLLRAVLRTVESLLANIMADVQASSPKSRICGYHRAARTVVDHATGRAVHLDQRGHLRL